MSLDYYELSWYKKILYRISRIYKAILKSFINFCKSLLFKSYALLINTIQELKSFILNFIHDNFITKISYFIMGLGHITRGQTARGVIYLITQICYLLYMILFGSNYINMFFENFLSGGYIGNKETTQIWNPEKGIYEKIVGDNSFHIILYSILTIFITIFFLIIYYNSVKESHKLEQYKIINKIPNNYKQDLNSLLDKKFHLTLLSLPIIGLFLFTVVPLVTMILIAFTNYDANHEVPEHLFEWIKLQNFKELFSTQSSLGMTFWRVLGWTLIWAIVATFSTYFLGMILALLINYRGTKLKKFYRTIFITTIAVPQFVSLLIMSKMLDSGGGTIGSGGGLITQLVENIFGYHLKFGLDISTTRIWIILVNMWIGIPYSMLICTGILMNIPKDLYESAKIDGASSLRQFFKITLPYMLFVTGPYLITQFIGNINNFNVIYLLSGGAPGDPLLYTNGAKGTDLLITWLYKLSLGADRNYKLASVIGILVFVISSVFSLIVYNKSSAVRGEQNFQ